MSSILGIYRVIQEEPLNFWMFLAVNLFFGGMAIWLPPAIATHHPIALASEELLKAIALGNGYLFALALLAASSSYMVREYRKNIQTDFKDLKLYATSISFILMIIMAIFLTAMLFQGFTPGPAENLQWHPQHMIQALLALLALFMAAYLFCLERIDEYPEFGKGLKDKSTRKIKEEMGDKSSTGIET